MDEYTRRARWGVSIQWRQQRQRAAAATAAVVLSAAVVYCIFIEYILHSSAKANKLYVPDVTSHAQELASPLCGWTDIVSLYRNRSGIIVTDVWSGYIRSFRGESSRVRCPGVFCFLRKKIIRRELSASTHEELADPTERPGTKKEFSISSPSD